MLVLSRKAGESLVIGDDIVVTMLNVGPRQVRIGVTAPKDIGVHREEIYLRIAAERECEAASPATIHANRSQPQSLLNTGDKL